MRHRALGTLFLVAVAAHALQAQPSTVILVRHAEKAAAPANDPALDSRRCAAGSRTSLRH